MRDDPVHLLFSQLENHGFNLILFNQMFNDCNYFIFYTLGLMKLPDYVLKLLLLTGYDNLHAISKLVNHKLIDDLEAYGTDFLEPTDLGLMDNEKKYYFSEKAMKFRILPGHRHLIIEAGCLAKKLLNMSLATIPDENESDFEKTFEVQQHAPISCEQPTNDELRDDCHDLLETTESQQLKESYPIVYSPESERESLARFIRSWIERKIQNRNLTAFIYEVDYRVLVYRPKSSNPITQTDIFLFVCHRCNTTIKVFKRRNGNSWNAANVYRHITTVHFNPQLLSIENTTVESSSTASQGEDLPLDLNIMKSLRSDSPGDQES